MSTGTLDSCNVQVTVRALSPLHPCQWPAALPKGRPARHGAMLDVVIGTMLVDGVAVFDESQAGELVLAASADWIDQSMADLPVAVQEVLNDLGSAIVAVRVRVVEELTHLRGPDP